MKKKQLCPLHSVTKDRDYSGNNNAFVNCRSPDFEEELIPK